MFGLQYLCRFAWLSECESLFIKLTIVSYSVDDLILKLGGESDEARGITANAHDKVVILAGILSSTLKLLDIGHIALEYLSALLEEGHKEG